MKILSIIVPSYNMEKYIARCLDSFIYDNMNDIEVVVVNDGSKDNTLKIALTYEYKYPNTFKVIDKENGGHGSTINKGIEVAQGKYFKVVDADDWVDTIALAKYVNILKDCNTELVATNYVEAYAETNKRVLIDFKNVEYNRNYSYKEIVEKNIRIPMHSITYKTSTLKDNNIRLQEKTFYVDIEYNLLPVPFVKSIVFYDLSLYQYFLGRPDQSVSRNSLLKNYDHTIRVDKSIINYYNNKSMETYQKQYYLGYVLSLIKNHYYCFANLPDSPVNNYNKCVDYENMLKVLNMEIYNKVSDIYIQLIRKTNCKIVKLLSILQPLWSYKIKKLITKN